MNRIRFSFPEYVFAAFTVLIAVAVMLALAGCASTPPIPSTAPAGTTGTNQAAQVYAQVRLYLNDPAVQVTAQATVVGACNIAIAAQSDPAKQVALRAELSRIGTAISTLADGKVVTPQQIAAIVNTTPGRQLSPQWAVASSAVVQLYAILYPRLILIGDANLFTTWLKLIGDALATSGLTL